MFSGIEFYLTVEVGKKWTFLYITTSKYDSSMLHKRNIYKVTTNSKKAQQVNP